HDHGVLPRSHEHHLAPGHAALGSDRGDRPPGVVSIDCTDEPGDEKWTLTSPSSGAAPAATPQRSAPPSSARRSRVSKRSPSSATAAPGSFPLRPPIEGLDSPRCVDSTGLLAQEQVPRRLVVLGGGIIGCEFASIFSRFGTEVTIIEMLESLIPQEDADAAKELAKQFGRRGIALQLGKQCTKVEDDGSQLTVHYGDGETVQADLMLVSVGRGPLVEGL